MAGSEAERSSGTPFPQLENLLPCIQKSPDSMAAGGLVSARKCPPRPLHPSIFGQICPLKCPPHFRPRLLKTCTRRDLPVYLRAGSSGTRHLLAHLSKIQHGFASSHSNRLE